jgi:hypothetical protein
MTISPKENNLPTRQSKFIEYPVHFIVGAVDIYVRLAMIAVVIGIALSILYTVIYLPLAWLYGLIA